MNGFVAIVLFCYLGSVLAQDCKCGVEMPMSRIIGGNTVSSLSKMPWMAMLTDAKGNQFCGASIISSKAILTAAHCTKGAKPSEIKVVIGTLKRKVDTKKMLAVSKIIVHKGYSARTVKNDISILILEEEINLDRHPPICIPSERESYYKLCVAGWGDTKNGAKLGSLNLLEVCFPENDPELCSDEDEEFSINPDQQIAAGDKGKDTCQGDSGGPLYTTIDYKNTQVGIVSYGKACGQKCAVYTRVSAYSAWIQSTLAKNKGGKQCV